MINIINPAEQQCLKFWTKMEIMWKHNLCDDNLFQFYKEVKLKLQEANVSLIKQLATIDIVKFNLTGMNKWLKIKL